MHILGIFGAKSNFLQVHALFPNNKFDMPTNAAKSAKAPKSTMAPAYEPKSVESKLYKTWEKSGFFNPDKLPNAKKRKPYTIVMPPPNATGTLHLGHAVMLALEDIAIRYKRLSGFASLWIPGTDHAAIATQTKVEKILKEEGKSRHDLGRARFLKRVETFVKGSQSTIRNQVRVMGSSCDWSRECYTLDKPRSEAVMEMFARMHKDGLVYRGERIVNWCPRCASTLADDEVEYKEEKAKLYFMKYGPFTVATTRPETKLGDTAVAVNPDDARYKTWIGKTFTVDFGIGEQTIKVIGDRGIDKGFGTGVLGVTPAHSAIDWAMAEKNNLPWIKVIGEDGKMTDKAGKYAGLTVLEARTKFVAELEAKGLIEKVEEITHNLTTCYRCGTTIEPLPSLQWFIDVNKKIPGRGKSLKELSLDAVKKKQIQILPDRFEKVYYNWMENLRDWCISRQIWFGHRIPAWYCITKDCGEIVVGKKAPTKCAKCKKTKFRQDEDTFDTWFSSGTWTFSTLGWPKPTKDLKRYHPTQLLETGYDILFFWVARMILMTEYAMKTVPFEKVYLHGLVRDEQGRKMSKSLGNIIDPLDVSAKYGTDAVRLSLTIGSTPGSDTRLSDEKIAYFRNFTNKLWNLSRFVVMTIEQSTDKKAAGLLHKGALKRPTAKSLADEWVLARLDQVISAVSADLDVYNFSRAGETLRDFTWNEVADWYLEIAKIEKGKEAMLAYVLQTILTLWHPFMPFVTEEVYRLLFAKGAKDMLMVASWPKKPAKTSAKEKKAIADFTALQEVIGAIRNLRAQYKVEPGKFVNVSIVVGKNAAMIKANMAPISGLAKIQSLTASTKAGEAVANAATAVVAGMTISMPLEGLVDMAKEKSRLENELTEAKRYAASLAGKLENKDFVSRAPAAVIEKERAKLAEQEEKVKELERQIAGLV